MTIGKLVRQTPSCANLEIQLVVKITPQKIQLVNFLKFVLKINEATTLYFWMKFYKVLYSTLQYSTVCLKAQPDKTHYLSHDNFTRTKCICNLYCMCIWLGLIRLQCRDHMSILLAWHSSVIMLVCHQYSTLLEYYQDISNNVILLADSFFQKNLHTVYKYKYSSTVHYLDCIRVRVVLRVLYVLVASAVITSSVTCSCLEYQYPRRKSKDRIPCDSNNTPQLRYLYYSTSS
jgi:hypothetical protein